jgi:hypothetical protein
MIKRLQTSVITALALLPGFCLKAQEQLMPLSANLQLMSVPAKNTQAARTASVSGLDTIPFFDDFSYSSTSPYPTANHWIDSNVFINHGFAIAPPSIGVATFDGLNKKGYPYNLSALVSNSAQADKLTSRPINLQKKGAKVYSPLDSIYLSFYYQAEGRGDAPEANDSLSVDFYKPNQKKWANVWSRKGYNPSGADSLFHLVMLPIKDTAYFDSLFQFRFRNRGTLSGSLDHWNVDYVYIDRNRSRVDTVMEDDAFQYMSSPFLKNYSSMPYRQYMASEMAPSIGSYIRNNFTTGKNTFYNYTVIDKNAVPTYSYNGGSANILPYSTNGLHDAPQHRNPSVPFAFPAFTDSAVYTIKHVISSNPDLQRQNDTIFQKQAFSTYYAYDDGTAEVGYYNNTFGAKNAVRYTINVADTLRAIRIYFDPVTDGQNIIMSTFRLMVWADGSNGPGNVIYRDSTMYPKYLQGNYNIMPTYKLTSCLLLSPGTYYFGLQQTTNKPLNIGFDKNTDHSNALYYDIGSGWTQSAIKGSLMINPMLGCYYPVTPVGMPDYQNRVTDRVSVYPNPAQNSIRIGTNGMVVENGKLSILSSVGQTVYSSSFHSSDEIDISSLPNGIYFVHLSCEELNTTPQKLIIAR